MLNTNQLLKNKSTCADSYASKNRLLILYLEILFQYYGSMFLNALIPSFIDSYQSQSFLKNIESFPYVWRSIFSTFNL